MTPAQRDQIDSELETLTIASMEYGLKIGRNMASEEQEKSVEIIVFHQQRIFDMFQRLTDGLI